MAKPVQTGDQELWIVSHDDWSLPISAIPVDMDGKECYAVSDIIGFTGPQFDAVRAKLAPAVIGMSGIFSFVPRFSMNTVATKAPGINAKWYVKWNRQSPVKPKLEFTPDEQIETPEPNASTREFIDHIVWRARSLSKEDVLFLWSVITEELPKWITERKKCVSFGYFTIWAVPYRANWKQILLSKFPKIASTMRMPRKQRDARLSMTDMELALQHTDLIRYCTVSNSIGWSIEAVPTKFWGEFVQDMESKRRKNLGAARYAKYWSRLVWVLQGVIYDIFGAFVAEACVPCSEPVKCDRFSSYGLGPCVPVGASRPISRDIVETHSVYHDASRQVVFHGTPKSLATLEETHARLPEVQPLQLEEENVRDGGRILPTNGESGA